MIFNLVLHYSIETDSKSVEYKRQERKKQG